MPLVVIHACDEPWDDMSPDDGGRRCARCDRTVFDATGLTNDQLVLHVTRQGGGCVRAPAGQAVRARSPFATCPERRRVSLALAGLAAVAMSACSAEQPHVRHGAPAEFTVAGCASPRNDPWAPAAGPSRESTDVCSAVPDAPQCTALATAIVPHDEAESRLPQHLRADCAEIEELGGGAMVGMVAVVREEEETEERPIPPERDYRAWPDGIDVFVADMTIEGIPWGSARTTVRRLLEPLGRCYAELVSRRPSDPPQGQMDLEMNVDADGTVTGVEVHDASVPNELVECVRATLLRERLGFLGSEYATMSLDLQFVYRRPFARPE